MSPTSMKDTLLRVNTIYKDMEARDPLELK